MFNFYHQRNENIAHNEISSHSIYNGYYKKDQTNGWRGCAQKGVVPYTLLAWLTTYCRYGKTLWKFLTGFQTDLTWSTPPPFPPLQTRENGMSERPLHSRVHLSAVSKESVHRFRVNKPGLAHNRILPQWCWKPVISSNVGKPRGYYEMTRVQKEKQWCHSLSGM